MKDGLLIDILLHDHIVLTHEVVTVHLISCFGWMEMEPTWKNGHQRVEMSNIHPFPYWGHFIFFGSVRSSINANLRSFDRLSE